MHVGRPLVLNAINLAKMPVADKLENPTADPWHIMGTFGSNFDVKPMWLYLILAKICKAMLNKKIKANK